jgi:cytochrome c oxidase subunit III
MSTTTVHQTKWWSGGKSPFNLEYGKLMMWYFLMSDAFTFGAFLISYGTIRFSQNFWPDPNVVFNAFPGICECDDVHPDHQFCHDGTGRTRGT